MRHGDEHRHGREIPPGVEGHRFVQAGRGRDGGITDEERVAVRRRLGHCVHADHCRGPGLVFDDDGHAKLLGNGLRDVARDHVRRAAGRPGHDPFDRAVGVGFGRGGDARERGARQHRCSEKPAQGMRDHGESPALGIGLAAGPPRKPPNSVGQGKPLVSTAR